jgi:hypothetical protein
MQQIVVISDKSLVAAFLTWAAANDIGNAREQILSAVDEHCPVTLSSVGEVDGLLEDGDHQQVFEILSKM